MIKDSVSTKKHPRSESSFPFPTAVSPRKLKGISDEKLEKVLADFEADLNYGKSAAAEKNVRETLENHSLTLENQAKLICLLSYALETLGSYKEALKSIQKFEDESILSKLSPETRISLLKQLAISYNNLTDYPKAIALLNKALKEATALNLRQKFGDIYMAMSRVYRKLSECPIAIDHAEKGLTYHREMGNWIGMAESYYQIAASTQQAGNSEKALEYYELAVKIIGERPSPFLLGKIYADMSGAYWFLRRPQDGIECLEKSIQFFQQTEHKVQSITAYNNLGINLMLLGDWDRAEGVIRQALDLAIETNHGHIAGIFDSLGELKLLRGDLDEAEKLLKKGINFAIERNREWYAIQAMRNLARCLLAKGETDEAAKKAEETIALCKKSGEKQIANMARLILAECFLENGSLEKCEKELVSIEDTDPSSDFFVLGHIQRIRGVSAEKQKETELALHHFNRSLTIFETADDLFHTALAHFLIGKTFGEDEPKKAAQHLMSASEIFRKLGVPKLFEEAEKIIAQIKDFEPKKKSAPSAGSQLLMVRLAEATASRELLFRELSAVLQQESRAKRIIIAEQNDKKQFYPFISHGLIPSESADLMGKFNEAYRKNEIETFAKIKNLQIFHLRAPSASPAFLIIHPHSGAVLNDGTPLLPLLRVVELGMDVCALREKDKPNFSEDEISPYTSQSLMPGFIHSSPAMTSLVEEVYKIRSSDVTVLVTGESGTGKELVSRAIHTLSNRKDKVFVPFNCTAVPKELAEGHLFGYRKGAFTGAVSDSPGIIRAADGGTLFLDEIGDLPLDVQPKLLRFLQEGEVQPIGEKKPIKVDVRVIAATNMPLEDKVADGSFREDLYYRLNVIRLRVPPLRERRSEIPPMVNYYVNHYSAKFGRSDISITPQAIDLLMVCDWDGNVRQLCNEIQRVVARASDGETITPEHLSIELKRNATPIKPFAEENGNVKPITSYTGGFFNSPKQGMTIEEAVSELEMQMINDSLRRNDWNISRVARELGLTRRGLYLKIARYGIEKAA
ncbi:MAG TPA: sigma 54-interacting transcriptional regulator [Pyrinomonadaceae bacterium]|nr:sigma 54-interacting transcriptional regulator [Pyrinomonadaceae bacterium]